jgi:hypothetical protein
MTYDLHVICLPISGNIKVKYFPVLDKAEDFEGAWGSGSTVHVILNSALKRSEWSVEVHFYPTILDFRKSIAFWKLYSLHPFVLLVRSIF